MSTSRRRGLLLLSLAVASGGLAASQVRERERSVEAQVGPLVPVLIAARNLDAGVQLERGSIAVREVPARFSPPDALSAPRAVIGARTSVAVAEGGYLTAGQLESAARGPGGPVLRRGERALEVAVAGGQALGRAAPGDRVDVLVSSEPRAAGGRTSVALEGVELLALEGVGGAGSLASPDEADGTASAAATAVATLRVSLEQAVYLTAAENFAREIRLLVRPAGDRARAGRLGVAASEL